MPTETKINDRTRKLLWVAADRCAFPGCDQRLVEQGPTGARTVVGIECHIVAQRDHPSVARAPCLLTSDERVRHRELVEDRHADRNVVLMCGVHSTLIDDPKQPFSVDVVLDFKRAHETSIARERDLGRRALSGELIGAATETLLEGITAMAEDSGAWDAKAMRSLVAADPRAAVWLIEQLGQPESELVIQTMVTTWPDPVAQGCDELAIALARKAERHGRYDLAATAWERLSDRASSPGLKADHLTHAAIDASIHGDPSRDEDLSARAAALDPDCIRLKIHRLDEHQPPEAVLEDLSAMSSPDETLQSLIELQRARCFLLLADLRGAEDCLDEASRLDPESLNVRSLSVNLRVQRARVGVRDDEEFPLGEIRAAKNEALALRRQLLLLRRFSESARMLMLAADADAVERDTEAAQRTLELADAREYGTVDAANVLGDAALRAQRPDLALRFTEDHEGDDGCRRIRATASLDLTAGRDEDSVRTLEALVAAGGREAVRAAGARLLRCVDGASFHEPSALVVATSPHQRIAHQMRALTLARAGHHEQAEAIADAHRGSRWGAELGLRLAVERGLRPRIIATARHLLTVGADPFGHYTAGSALAQAGRLDDAATILGGVARNLNAPEQLRDDAFARLLRVHADRNAWDDAAAVWRDWERTLAQGRRSNVQLGAWHVRVANRTSARRSSP